MDRLETQINQIYLADPDNPKSSLFLYEEALNDDSRLFLVAEVSDLSKKTEQQEFRKVADLILVNFKNLKRSATDELFESALSRINNDLADLAVKGKKSWLGKFSALVAIISNERIFLANTGATAAYLKRKSELMEILPSEKKGLHPLKIFTNFTSGKLKLKDQIILTTSNVFNFIALKRAGEILDQFEQKEAVEEMIGILKDSVSSQNSFCGFVLSLTDQPQVADEPRSETLITAPIAESEYAPASEEKRSVLEKFKPAIPKLSIPVPRLSAPKLPRIPIPKLEMFAGLSAPRKFFLVSFLIFLIILSISVVNFLLKQNSRKTQEAIVQQSDRLATLMNDAESAFIYENEEEAFRLLNESYGAMEELKKLSGSKAEELSPMLSDLDNKINKKSVVENPQVVIDLKANPIHIARVGNGFIFSNASANSIFTLQGGELENVFMLNRLDSEIVGLAHAPSLGTVVATKSRLYRINEVQKEFESVSSVSDRELNRIKYLNSRFYSADKTNGQALRFVINAGQVSSAQTILRSPAPTEGLQDIGVDTDVYLLYSDRLRKYTNGAEIALPISELAQPMSDAKRLTVGNSIYILEPAKNRLILFSKAGRLQQQIHFPNAQGLTDFYVDESTRNIYLIDSNKLLKITF